MKDIEKLMMLADNCSDVLYGGESGWERVPFKQFVDDCRMAIAFGVKCKVAGLVLPEGKVAINAATKLCAIYFGIAAECIGEEKVRECRDLCISKLNT